MKNTAFCQRTTIEEYISAYNSLDVDRMLSFVHPDVEFQNVSESEVNAAASVIDELRKMAEQSKRLFSSRHQSITSYEEEGETVKVGIKFRAILAVDMPNGAKAGDNLNLGGQSVFKFRDGKLWRITDYS
jgi:ketosteroid isomerase-like protein